MSIDNLLSGLVGSLIGALFGFSAALFIEIWRVSGQRRGALLNITSEISDNVINLRSYVLHNTPFTSISFEAWGALRYSLAAYVDLVTYNRLSSNYLALAYWDKILQAPGRRRRGWKQALNRVCDNFWAVRDRLQKDADNRYWWIPFFQVVRDENESK